MKLKCRVLPPMGEKVRCTRDIDHRGPHWAETEPVPADCACTFACSCGIAGCDCAVSTSGLRGLHHSTDCAMIRSLREDVA